MLFQKIRWKNFLSTGNTITEVDLSKRGSTLVVGENGAGKSTILDALSFVLYGRPFRNIQKAQLVNSINKKDAVVEVDLTIGGKQYTIRRGLKPNVFEIYVDDQLIDQHADVKQYQEYLEKHILKFNQKAFNQIVILGSASFTPFMQLSATNRREIIEDLLDINIFSKMNVLLKQKVVDNREQIMGAESDIKLATEKIKIHLQHIEIMAKANDEVVLQKQATIKEIKQTNKGIQDDIAQIDSSIVATSAALPQLEKKRTIHNTLIEIECTLEDRKQKLVKEIKFLQTTDDCPTCLQSIDDHFRSSNVEQKQNKLVDVEDGLVRIAAKISRGTAIATLIEEISKKVGQYEIARKTALNEIALNDRTTANHEKDIVAAQSNNVHISTNENEIATIKAIQKQSTQKLEELQKDKQIIEVAGFLLKDTGIKTKIIKQYIPIMNKLVNKYLASMDFFVQFELNEKFEETIRSRFRDDFTYQSFSEGEKMRIDLALLFTWRSIAKMRNSASTNLLIMDEVFDSSLDSSGTEEFMKILNTLTKDNNMFIISHKGDQLFDRFTNIIKFEKHKNFSRIAA